MNISRFVRASFLVALAVVVVGGGIYFSHKSSQQTVLQSEAVNVGGWFWKDSSHVWYEGQAGPLVEIKDADVATFVYTDNNTAKDAHHTYSFDTKGHLAIDDKSTHVVGSSDIAVDQPKTDAPFIKVLSANKDYPSTITVQYANLPSRTSGLAVCVKNAGCTEWVEDFHPATPSGTYTMSAAKAFGANSSKTLGRDQFIVVALGSNFSDQIIASDTYTVPSSVITVAGMSQYTDKDFGFSFWYPSRWSIKESVIPNPNLQDGTVVKRLDISQGEWEMSVVEFTSPSMSITDTGGAGPFGPIRYWFDATSKAWMTVSPMGSATGAHGSTEGPATSTASLANKTIGGLYMFAGTSRFNTSIIPLNAQHFLVIGDGGGPNASLLAKTVTSFNSSGANSVSMSEQLKAIEAEKKAYVDSFDN